MVGGGGAHPRATNDAPFACGAAAPRPRCARPPRRARRAIRAPLRARPAGRLREGSGRLPPAEPSAPPSSSSHTSRTPRTYRKVPRRFREGSSSPHEPRRRAPPPASPRRPAGRRSPWRRVGGGAGRASGAGRYMHKPHGSCRCRAVRAVQGWRQRTGGTRLAAQGWRCFGVGGWRTEAAGEESERERRRRGASPWRARAAEATKTAAPRGRLHKGSETAPVAEATQNEGRHDERPVE